MLRDHSAETRVPTVRTQTQHSCKQSGTLAGLRQLTIENSAPPLSISVLLVQLGRGVPALLRRAPAGGSLNAKAVFFAKGSSATGEVSLPGGRTGPHDASPLGVGPSFRPHSASPWAQQSEHRVGRGHALPVRPNTRQNDRFCRMQRSQRERSLKPRPYSSLQTGQGS